MRYFKLVSVLVIISICQSFSQENQNTDSAKDSTIISNTKLKSELQFKNFFKNDIKQGLDNNTIIGLNLYAKALNDSAFKFQSTELNFNEYSTEELKDFNTSFQMLMKYANEERSKYELGVIGKYLGISRKIMAIILAILSAAK